MYSAVLENQPFAQRGQVTDSAWLGRVFQEILVSDFAWVLRGKGARERASALTLDASQRPLGLPPLLYPKNATLRAGRLCSRVSQSPLAQGG